MRHVAATKSNWFNFVRHVAATKFCRGDKILIEQASNVEAFTPGDLSLQPIAAMSACDLPLDCTHKAICCSNVLQQFVASCVPAFSKKYSIVKNPKNLRRKFVLVVYHPNKLNVYSHDYCEPLCHAHFAYINITPPFIYSFLKQLNKC